MESQNNKKQFQKTYFDVLGLCCSSEVPLIESILKPRDGVKEVSVIIATRTVIVIHDTLLISPSQIEKVLNEARLEANVRVYGQESFKKKWPSPYALACGALLLLSLLKYVYRPFGWLALAAVAIGILPICLKAIAAIRNFRVDINILAIIAVIGTIAMRDYLEAGTIVFLFTIAEWLESRASHKANAVMTSLMNMVPQKAVIAETGEVVDADKVSLSTVVAVKAGEVIPIDGVVVEGTCEVDEKTLTGESFPVTKQKDATAWAGTINLNGYISVRTTALAQDCAVAKMAKLVEEAQNSKSKTQRLIDKCAKFYTPAVMIISISVAVIPAALKAEHLRRWFHLALVIMVSACPCGLILSTPVATFCALTKAAKSGLLIKGGDYLETLSKIKIVAFDKTGTITRGEISITNFDSLRDDISVDDLLYWVSSIESKSSHPMAAALVDHAKSLSIEAKPENVEDFENFPGEGIHGRIDGRDVYVGNKKISTRASCETVPKPQGYAKGGKSIGYIYCDGTPAGIFSLSDACRSGVLDAIKELKALGIRTAMLTGDSHAAAMYAHEQTGHSIDAIHAELLPEDKARIIKQFKTEGRTAMVGDGMNDAAALATADIGISMGISGSALASESGNVILLSNDMRRIPKAVRLARRAQAKVVQNIVVSVVTKVAIIALAIAGHPLVWAAVLADTGTCLLVIINSMFLLKESHNHGGKCRKSSSSSSHAHKRGCKDGHGKSPSRKGHQCCSNKKVQHACEVTVCQTKASNPTSCCENKGGSYFTDVSAKSQHCHRRICGTVNHDSESNDSHCHGSSVQHARLGSCEEVDHHTNHGSNHCLRSVSPVTESLNVASKAQGHLICCVQNHVATEPPQKRAELACTHQHRDEHTCAKNHDKSHTGIDGGAEIVSPTSEGQCRSICSGENHVAAKSAKKATERACDHQHQDGVTHSIKHEECHTGNDIVAETVNLASKAQGHSICCGENHVATGPPQEKAVLACTHQHEDVLPCSKGHEKAHTSVCGVTETVNLARKEQGHSTFCDTAESSKPKAEASCGNQHHDGHTHSTKQDKYHTSIDMSQADETSEEIVPASTSIKTGIIGGCCKKSHERDLFPGSAVASACLSIEKREVVGCCKSYMKQCCSTRHGHLGAVLSEVVIEH